MITRYIAVIAATAAALALSTSAAAQDDVRWAATLRPGAIEVTSGLTVDEENTVSEDGVATLTLTCEDGARCDEARVTLETVGEDPSDLSAERADTRSAVYVIPGTQINLDGKTTVLVIRMGDAQETFTLGLSGAARPKAGTRSSSVSLANLLARDCRSEVALPNSEHYDEGRDMARFVVTPVGTVLRRPGPVIDEGDSVRVQVLADSLLLPLLKVRRTSAIRTVGSVRFIGQDANLSGFVRQARNAAGVALPRPCGVYEFVLHDFASGKGEVEIRALTGKSEADEMTQAVGTFDFNVNPLYSGAFSLGAMRTELSEPDFGLNVDGADSTITVRSNGPYRVKYVLMYTHFIWGKRDVEKLPSNLLQRINPSIGVVLDDITENFVGGLTADLFEGVYLSGGAHFGRVEELDPESGLEVGDAFSGDEDDIPTLERWRVKPFFSVGVDVRAAAELLRMALTGSKAGS